MAQVARAPVDRRVLLVEDDKDLRLMAARKLREAGYEPILASSGVEAVRLMLRHPECRQMITDYLLPELGGEEWIAFLERFCPDWSVVVISAEDVDPGGFISVPKPARFDNIISHLEHFVR